MAETVKLREDARDVIAAKQPTVPVVDDPPAKLSGLLDLLTGAGFAILAAAGGGPQPMLLNVPNLL